MRKLRHRWLRSSNRYATGRAIRQGVEALEPRVVLAAMVIGLEGTHGPARLHDRHASDRGDHRPADWKQLNDDRAGLPPVLANRTEPKSLKPAGAGHPNGARLPVDLARGSGRGAPGYRPQSSDPPEERVAIFAEPEDGKRLSSPIRVSTAFDPLAEVLLSPHPLPSTAVPTLTDIVTAPAPTTSAANNNLLLLARPAAELAELPSALAATSARRPTQGVSNLPIESPVSVAAPTPASPAVRNLEPSSLSRDSGAIDRDAAALRLPSGNSTIAEIESEAFVSWSTDEWLVRLDQGRGALEAVEASLSQPAQFTWPGGGTDHSGTMAEIAAPGRHTQDLEESLWAELSEGGLVEIGVNTDVGASEHFEFAEELDDLSNVRPFKARTPREAFWFDFDAMRRDLIGDWFARQAIREGAELDRAWDSSDDAWMREDGGMIVLLESEFVDDANPISGDNAGDAVEFAGTAGEIDIPMDAGIGVFRVIEVATVPLENPTSKPTLKTVEEATALHAGESAVDADESMPSSEQAAGSSPSSGEVLAPLRATALPLLFAIARLGKPSSENSKRVTIRRRKS